MKLSDIAAFLFPYRAHLEAELRQQHEDFLRLYDNQAQNYKERMIEKDAEIRRLRAELATSRVTMNAVAPERTRSLQEPVPDAPLDWQDELNKMLQEEDDGILNTGRIQEHKPSANDGAQAEHGAEV